MDSGQAPPVVWIVVPQQWTRALLRAELIERGCDAVGFLSADDALEHLVPRAPDAIVVELSGLPRAHLARLVRVGVPVIATGPAEDAEDPEVGRLGLRALIPRPVTLGEIADRVESELRRA